MEETDYLITVKTSDKQGAGTDANVFVKLFGLDGASLELNLKNSQKFNKFERNSVDKFTFNDQKSCGKLQTIMVWHDDTGFGSSWHLEYIEISDISSGQKYRFPCHRWLSKTEDDKRICRELKCTEISAGPRQSVQLATGVEKKLSLEECMTSSNSKSTFVNKLLSCRSGSLSRGSSPTRSRGSDGQTFSSEYIPQTSSYSNLSASQLIKSINSHESTSTRSSRLIETSRSFEVYSKPPMITVESVYGPYSNNHNSSSLQNESSAAPITVMSKKRTTTNATSVYGPYSSPKH